MTTSAMIDGKRKVYAGIQSNQQTVKMDAETAKSLFYFYNKYVELQRQAEQSTPNLPA